MDEADAGRRRCAVDEGTPARRYNAVMPRARWTMPLPLFLVLVFGTMVGVWVFVNTVLGGIAGWLLLAGAIFSSWYFVERPRQLRIRGWAKGQCERCGYDLRGTPGWCPECGTHAKDAARP